MDLAREQAQRATARVTRVLELVAAHPTGVRLNRLVGGLDSPKSVVRAVVEQLVAGGYLTGDDGRFTLGPAVADLLPRHAQLAMAAGPALDALRDRFDETAILATNIGDSVVNVAAAETRRSIRYSAPLHVPRPIFPSSAGKVFLAHWPAARRDALLATLVPDPDQRRRVAAELATVRTDGVAYNRGETSPEVAALACPVVVEGAVVGALVVAGPLARIAEHLPEMATEIRTHATRIP